jgi:hypothetical protein
MCTALIDASLAAAAQGQAPKDAHALAAALISSSIRLAATVCTFD